MKVTVDIPDGKYCTACRLFTLTNRCKYLGIIIIGRKKHPDCPNYPKGEFIKPVYNAHQEGDESPQIDTPEFSYELKEKIDGQPPAH